MLSYFSRASGYIFSITEFHFFLVTKKRFNLFKKLASKHHLSFFLFSSSHIKREKWINVLIKIIESMQNVSEVEK